MTDDVLRFMLKVSVWTIRFVSDWDFRFVSTPNHDYMMRSTDNMHNSVMTMAPGRNKNCRGEIFLKKRLSCQRLQMLWFLSKTCYLPLTLRRSLLCYLNLINLCNLTFECLQSNRDKSKKGCVFEKAQDVASSHCDSVFFLFQKLCPRWPPDVTSLQFPCVITWQDLYW